MKWLVVFLVAVAMSMHAQDSQFVYDPNGNLVVQNDFGPNAAPQILTQPQSQLVQPSEVASFFVVAADARGLNYQWRFNGTNLVGATSDTFLITNVSAAMEGQYTVVLTNSSGSVTSAPAALLIDSDADGLPDSWEKAYFTSLSQFAYGDSDGDGVSNGDEFHDGTNPTNSASALFRLSVVSDGGVITFSPDKAKYTNGEVVTVTATPVGSEKFHGWTGDVVTTNSQVVLTMTTNRFLTAYFNYYTIVWTNTTTNTTDWHTATNWSPNLVPAMGDTAVINISTTVTLNTNAECGALLLGAAGVTPIITGSGTLTIYSNGVWTTGTMTGASRTIIGSNATFTISNTSTVFLDSRALENAGTIIWSGSDSYNIQCNNAVITNRPGALFDVRNNTSFYPFPGNGRFDNAGTLRKSGSTGTSKFDVNSSFGTVFTFNNYGATEVQSGTLLCSAAFVNNGAVAVSSGATMRIAAGGSGSGTFSNQTGGLVDWTGSGTFTLGSGGLLNGNGLFKVSSGTVALNTDLAIQNVDLIGTLTGSGKLTISNVLNWTSGNMTGTGRTIIAAGATNYINNLTSKVFLVTRTFENDGTVIWTGADNFDFQVSGTAITNAPGALFEVRNNGGFFPFPASSRFDNSGTLRKTSSGTTRFDVSNFGTAFPFNNYGTTEIQSGTLLCNANFVNNGVITVSSGATMRMAAGGSANGTFNNPSGALVDWTGGTSTFTVSPGALLNGSGLYKVSAGTVALNTDLNVQNMDVIATLSGSGTLTINNVLNWTGGTMGGTGRTIIATGATNFINNQTVKVFLDTRVLENAGTIIWTGADNFDFQVAGSVITNRAGALFEVRNNGGFFPYPGNSRFDNAGILRKTSSGTTRFDVSSFSTAFAFNNYATTEVQAGTLLCNSTCVNSGTINLSPGATLRMAAGGSITGTFNNPATSLVDWTGSSTFTVSPGALLSGNGLYKITSGTVNFATDVAVQNLDLMATIDGGGKLTVSNVLNWTAGNMNGTGRTIIAPGATNFIKNLSSTVFLNARTLENAGTIVWTGADNYNLQCSGAVITNRPGALFEVRNNGSFYPFPANSRFDNAGTLRKIVGTGTTRFDANGSFGTIFPFNNYGTLDIQSGIIAPTSGYTCTSGSTLQSLLSSLSSYGRLQASGTVTLNGALSVTLTNGYYPSSNDTFTVFTAGTRNGAFSSFTYPSNVVAMQLSNTTTSVIVRVTDITLTNGAPVLFSDVPASPLFYDGRTFALATRVAGGQPFTFQWQKDGTNLTNSAHIGGANDAILYVTNALRASDAGNYRLFITNSEGSVTSRVSTVTIQAVPKFNGAGAGWSLQGTTIPPMNTNTATLTSGLGNTGRSVFYNAPLYIRDFLAQFVYVDVGGGGADGVVFCIHNYPDGAKVVGGGGGGLGYAGITPSAGLAMNIYQPNTRGISWRTNGTLPSPPYTPIGSVNLGSGNPISVSLLYTEGVLRATFVESNTANTFTTNLNVNIPAMVGGDTAFVGFTGGDGGVGSTQVISNFTFIPITGLTTEQGTQALAVSWPASIGGYTLQVRSNLNAETTWEMATNSIDQVSGRNRATISPLLPADFFQLKINPAE